MCSMKGYRGHKDHVFGTVSSKQVVTEKRTMNSEKNPVRRKMEPTCRGRGLVLLTLWAGYLAVGIENSSAVDGTLSVPAAPSASRQHPATFQERFLLGDYQVGFSAPLGWRKVEQPAVSKVSFYSPDDKAVITVRVHPDTFAPQLLMSEKALLLMKRYPNAVKGLETQWSGARHTGRLIDFTRTEQKGQETPLKFRLAAAPVGGGLLEVLFTAQEPDFTRKSPICDAILRSIECVPHRESSEGVAAPLAK